jgi:pilus assembly protein Flp/PilA
MSSKTKLRDTITLMRRRLAGNEQGATAIEYALIAAGIGAAVAATVYSLGTATKGLYSSIAALL